MNISQITDLLFWSMVINVCLLTLSSVLIMVLRPTICRMHEKLFGLKEEHVSVVMYCFLGMYKLLVITFNIAPWIALRILS